MINYKFQINCINYRIFKSSKVSTFLFNNDCNVLNLAISTPYCLFYSNGTPRRTVLVLCLKYRLCSRRPCPPSNWRRYITMPCTWHRGMTIHFCYFAHLCYVLSFVCFASFCSPSLLFILPRLQTCFLYHTLKAIRLVCSLSTITSIGHPGGSKVA